MMWIEKRSTCSPTVVPTMCTRNVDSLQHTKSSSWKQQHTATSKSTEKIDHSYLPTTLTTPTPSNQLDNSQQAWSSLMEQMPVSSSKSMLSTCKPVLLSELMLPMSSCIKLNNVFSHSPPRPPNFLYSSFSCKYPLLG